MPFDMSTVKGQRAHYRWIKAQISDRGKRAASRSGAMTESIESQEVSLGPKKYLGPRNWIFVASPPKGKNVVAHVINQVALKYNVSPMDITSTRRTREITIPRHEVFYRLRTLTEMSFPMMARLVGNRDHTTAQHSYNRFRELLAKGEVQL